MTRISANAQYILSRFGYERGFALLKEAGFDACDVSLDGQRFPEHPLGDELVLFRIEGDVAAGRFDETAADFHQPLCEAPRDAVYHPPAVVGKFAHRVDESGGRHASGKAEAFDERRIHAAFRRGEGGADAGGTAAADHDVVLSRDGKLTREADSIHFHPPLFRFFTVIPDKISPLRVKVKRFSPGRVRPRATAGHSATCPRRGAECRMTPDGGLEKPRPP